MTLRKHVWKPILDKRRPVLNKLDDVKRAETLPREDIEQIQQGRLQSILDHAYQNVPYYTEAFDEPPEAGRIDELPLLEKETLRARFEDLKSSDLPDRDWYDNTSGGSTGKPVNFVQDTEYRGWNEAVKRVFDAWGGRDISDPKVRIWGAERDIVEGVDLKTRVGRWLRNEHIVNSFSLNDETMAEAVETINEQRPVMIHGYVESVEQLAQYIERECVAIHSPESVHVTSGTLYPEMREQIERVFGARVHNRYGCREFGNIACECSNGNGLHISPLTHYVEIVDRETGDPVAPGESGEVVVTGLVNYSMPLIRYPLGDIAVRPESDTCRCGCNWPRLAEVKGRVSDIFTAPDGTKVHGMFFSHAMYGRDWVKLFQAVQHTPDEIEVRIIPYPDVDMKSRQSELDEIADEFESVLGPSVSVDFSFPDEIEREESGKYRFLISHVEDSDT